MNEPAYKTVKDKFDRAIGELTGLPDVRKCKETTKRTAMPIVGDAQTFVIQTFRRLGNGPEAGYTVFLEYFDADGHKRLVIPPAVSDVIDRQRQALSDRIRRESAKRVAQERKARGELPAFMKTGRGKKRKAGKKATGQS